jgi:tetratricopeptide (TPR) repeat protein
LIVSQNAKAALDLLNGAPASQAGSSALIAQKNWALWALGDMTEMRKGIDSALAQGKSAELLIQDGLWKLKAGQSLAARSALEAALNLNPADLRGLDALRQTYSKDTSAALAKVKEYAAKQPNSAPVQDYLGVLLMVQRDFRGARAALEAANKADPKYLKAERALVQLDVVEGKIDDAVKKLDKMIAADPGDALARLWMGKLNIVRGNGQSARTHLQSVVAAQPNNADALNNLAYLLAEQRSELDQALKYAQKAVELNPDNPAHNDTLGWVLYTKGLYSAAIPFLEKAATAKEAVHNYHLAMAYAKAGQASRGKTALDAGLKLDPKLPEAQAALEIVGQSQ